MTAEEFTTITAGTVERRDANVRQVSNGFVISATRRFIDPEHETNKFAVNSEGVAMDVNLLMMALDSFFRTGELAAKT